ncbi:hypothetical protein [Tautonia rosea]|uniref:hypothetical protein n=1 Tax=Tautonia rosea TaxID=2728037 RepID=UPI00147565BE|nr:hypothetical protein [Tautonia rosea]
MTGREELRALSDAALGFCHQWNRVYDSFDRDGVSGAVLAWEYEEPLAETLGALVDALDGLQGIDPAVWPRRVRLAVANIRDEAHAVADRWGWGPILEGPEARDAWMKAGKAAWHQQAERPMLEVAIARQEAATDIRELPEWIDDLAETGRRLGCEAATAEVIAELAETGRRLGHPDAPDLVIAWKESRRVWASTPYFGSKAPWRDEPQDDRVERQVRIHRAAEVIQAAVKPEASEPDSHLGAGDRAGDEPARLGPPVPCKQAGSPALAVAAPPDEDDLENDLRRDGKPTQAALVAFMRGRDTADLSDVGHAVHGDSEATDKCISVNIGRVNRASEALGCSVRYRLSGGRIWKETW